MIKLKWFLPLALAALAACVRGTQTATVLSFEEREAEGETFATRMLITSGHLRIDDGAGTDGYILLDRAARTVYSVSHADRRIVVIEPLPVTLAPPKRFEHRSERDPEAYPPVGGHKVTHHRLYTNGVLCQQVFAAEGLLPEALVALREYHGILAGEHAQALPGAPAEMRTDCDLADEVFLPQRHLDHGFPIHQRRRDGRARELTDYRSDAAVERALFELPADYRHFRIAELRR
jgi:hypothetical protein